jgi:hypothetical protein
METAMNRIGTFTMTKREQDQLKIIQALVDGNIKPGLAAERLGLTVRQTGRLESPYRIEGP